MEVKYSMTEKAETNLIDLCVKDKVKRKGKGRTRMKTPITKAILANK